VTTKSLLSLAESSPNEQVTVAVEVPGPVFAPTVHFQVTFPDDPATGSVCKPFAVDTAPEA
jgi:hypothetical protein